MIEKSFVSMFSKDSMPSYSIVENMLKSGADVNEETQDGQTPLLRAAVYSDDSKILKLLLEYGAKVNIRDDIGRTPLMAAVIGNKIDNVKLLLDYGANVNSFILETKETPIILGCMWADKKVVELLVEHNANINAQNTNGYNALMVAIECGKYDIVEFLLEQGVVLTKEIKQFAKTFPKFVASEIGKKLLS